MVRGSELFFALFNNLALFIALVTLYGFLLQKLAGTARIRRQSVIGLLFGIFAIGCMHARIPVFEGVIVDQRNAIVALSGAFGGPTSALISAVMAGGYRIYLGGAGVLGGVVGVSLSAAAGIILNRFPRTFGTFGKAALSALAAVIIILPGFLFINDFRTGWQLMIDMSLPYGFAIFTGILLAGLLLNRQEERLDFEESFRRSEKQYRELIEGTQDLITHTDPDGNLTFVNHMSEKFLGPPPSECVGMSTFSFFHPDDLDKARRTFEEFITKRKTSMRLENRLINAVTGKTLNVLWVCDFHYNPSGALLGVVSIGRDVTERKRVEEERDLLRRYLADIVDSSPSIVIGVDRNFRVTLWNRTVHNITGLSSEEAEGRMIGEVFSRLAARTEEIEEAMRTGEAQHIARSRFVLSDGSTGFEDIVIYPLSAEELEGAVIRLDNVSERVKMEESLIQSDKMFTLGGLAAGMAHEINNPLAGIVQNAEVLTDRLLDESMPANIEAAESAGITMESIIRFMETRRVPRILGSIRDSGLRVSEIVEDMLNFARKSDTSFSSYDPAGLMDRSLDLAATDYGLKAEN